MNSSEISLAPLWQRGKCEKIRLDLFPVIPAEALHRMVYRAEAGIQYFQAFMNRLDPGFHRGDD